MTLAEQLLGEIELGQLDPMSVARKAGRLARLLDDVEAMKWLGYESAGYPGSSTLDPDAWAAARRSGRVHTAADGALTATTAMLGQLAAELDAARTDLAAGTGDTSDSQYAVVVENNKARRRNELLVLIAQRQEVLDRVIGAIHEYVAVTYQELRFGSAVEGAFDVVRATVDRSIVGLVPDALPMIAAAFENASSDSPEHWQNAASTCRRLLMAAADKLRPPGENVGARKMGPGNYVNRLVDWIVNQTTSSTSAAVITADLEYLGKRLDAVDGAGQKGAHLGVPVTRYDASRFLTGTYLVLGDILRLWDRNSQEQEAGEP